MPDLDKVIKGLELCLGSIDSAGCPEECPYYEACKKYENYAVFQPLMRDALEALKAQEPIAPKILDTAVPVSKTAVRFVKTYWCGACGEAINQSDVYCRKCGQAVKWDD